MLKFSLNEKSVIGLQLKLILRESQIIYIWTITMLFLHVSTERFTY